MDAADERNLFLIAAGVAFYGMFAVFPGMAAVIAIWGFFADPHAIEGYLDVARELMPVDAYAVLEDQFARLMDANVSTLGWTTAISLAIGLYAAHSGVSALITGLNTLHARIHRPTLARIGASTLMTLAVIALLLAALGIVVVVPVLLNFVPLGRFEGIIVTFLPYVVLFLAVLTFLGLFYRWAPNQEWDERHGWVTPGAVVAALLWAAASVAFSVYLANFGTYNRIYGSIGAVIALMMWFYISAFIVLFGGVLNAELARLRPIWRRRDQ